MAAVPEAREVARHVRPRLLAAAVSPRMVFLERWRPFVKAQIVIVRGKEYVFWPYAEGAILTVDDALVNMIDVADGRHANEVLGTVALSIPELAVESRRTLELHWYSVAGLWSTRPIRRVAVPFPPLPWTALGHDSAEELLAGLRLQADEILLDVWARRQLAAQELADTLPQDVLQFAIAPYISYTRQKNHKRRQSSFQPGRRRRNSCRPGMLCTEAQVDAYAKRIGW